MPTETPEELPGSWWRACLGPMLCRLLGHSWPIIRVDPFTLRTSGIGTCRRCRCVATRYVDTGDCEQCSHPIVAADGATWVCSSCGGEHRRAIVQD